MKGLRILSKQSGGEFFRLDCEDPCGRWASVRGPAEPAGPLCLKRFLETGEKTLRSRATWLTAPGGLGPVIVTAPPAEIDYGEFTDEKSGVALYLERIMDQNGRARAVQELGQGNFKINGDGVPHYEGKSSPGGLILDGWQ